VEGLTASKAAQEANLPEEPSWGFEEGLQAQIVEGLTENIEAQEANLPVSPLRGFDTANTGAQEPNLSDRSSQRAKWVGWSSLLQR
jgi:hypothetical protein